MNEQTIETTDERGFYAYTIIDSDSGERFSTTDYQGADGFGRAQRRREQLAQEYGKQFALAVAGIDSRGNLHEISE